MQTFVVQRITRSQMISLPAAPDQVFPLFEPLGEKHWATGWNPHMLYPASGITQEGMVFTTQHAHEPTKIWTIIAYERELAHVAYFNVLPQSHTSKVDVRCKSAEAQKTIAHISYTLTALTPTGNTYLDTFTQEHFQTWISSWQTAISDYILRS